MKRVTIVGVGALGSHVALLLRNEAALKVVDFDRIESKNVLAQFHSKTSIGKNKASALQQTISFLFGLKTEAVPHKLTSDNAEQLLGGTELIVDCLDNAAARKVVQDYARRTSTPCLHGALAADGGFGRVVWDDRFVIDGEAGAGAATCEGGEHLPFIAIVSAYIARSAQMYLKSGKKIGFEINPIGGAIAT